MSIDRKSFVTGMLMLQSMASQIKSGGLDLLASGTYKLGRKSYEYRDNAVYQAILREKDDCPPFGSGDELRLIVDGVSCKYTAQMCPVSGDPYIGNPYLADLNTGPEHDNGEPYAVFCYLSYRKDWITVFRSFVAGTHEIKLERLVK